MSIDSEPQKDLTLSAENADGIVGGNKKARMTAKHTTHQASVKALDPLMVVQEVTYGPTQVSANSGDDDCVPDPSSQDATS